MKKFQRLYGHDILKQRMRGFKKCYWNPDGFKSKSFVVTLHELQSGAILIVSRQKNKPIQSATVTPGHSIRFSGRDLDGVVKGEFFNV